MKEEAENYFSVPLAILRYGDSALESLEAITIFGAVSIGIGMEVKYPGEVSRKQFDKAFSFHAFEEFGNYLDPFKMRSLSDTERAAIVGSFLIDKEWNSFKDLRQWSQKYDSFAEKTPYFTVKLSFVNQALLTEQATQAGESKWNRTEKPIEWNEFRILAAIYSGQINSERFCFMGWEQIQARASGFCRNEDFKSNRASLPAQAKGLSRKVIRNRLDRLELNHFFLRYHYSKGAVGGRTAYSIRHKDRESLAESILRVETKKRRLEIHSNRESDFTLNQEIARKLKGQGRGQGRGQGEGQHKEKDSFKKASKKKTSNSVKSGSPLKGDGDREHGRIVKGKFVSTLELTRLVQSDARLLAELSVYPTAYRDKSTGQILNH